MNTTPEEIEEHLSRLDTAGVDAEQKERIEEIRTHHKALMASLLHACPKSRLRALALTAIEEALMWCIKAIAHSNGAAE